MSRIFGSIHDDFNRVAWVPPREDRFAQWCEIMEGYTEYTIAELFDEVKDAFDAMRNFKVGNTSEASEKAVQRCVDAYSRTYANEPFAYFSDEDQTAFENLLKNITPRIDAK